LIILRVISLLGKRDLYVGIALVML
jgi:hypothetical protein